MRKEVAKLVDKVRSLGLKATGHPSPNCVRFGGKAEDVPNRLLDVQAALEELDAAGGLSVTSDTERQLERLQAAVDSIIRLMKIQGVDVKPALDLVADALDVTPVKRKKAYKTLPVFAMDGWKKKKSFQPKLLVLPDYEDRGNIKDVQKHAFEVESTNMLMGAAAVRPSRP